MPNQGNAGQSFLHQSGQVFAEVPERRHCRHERRQRANRLQPRHRRGQSGELGQCHRQQRRAAQPSHSRYCARSVGLGGQPPVGYAAVGGFNANTPTTPGHVFQVTCGATCASFTWLDKTGNLPDIPVDSIINNPNYPQQVFAGTDFGLYFTNDITAASPVWYRFKNGLPTL